MLLVDNHAWGFQIRVFAFRHLGDVFESAIPGVAARRRRNWAGVEFGRNADERDFSPVGSGTKDHSFL